MYRIPAPLLIVALSALSACSAPPSEAIELPGTFSDHMVLQRDQPITISGKGDPGKAVAVEFAGQKKKTVVAKDGSWSIQLDAMPAKAAPQTLQVNHVELQDILIGDVWLCGGQSNMEWPLAKTLRGCLKSGGDKISRKISVL